MIIVRLIDTSAYKGTVHTILNKMFFHYQSESHITSWQMPSLQHSSSGWGYCIIVKWVSWFKSSLLLRIQIQYTNKLQFLIKTKSSIFNRKVCTTDSKREPSVSWLELIETDSILIKEKCKHLSKMSDRVCKRWERAQAIEVWVEKVS